MKIYYNDKYNIDLGILNYLHPFDGKKFKHIYDSIRDAPIEINSPKEPVNDSQILPTINDLLAILIKQKQYIFRALEIPYIPFVSYEKIDSRILQPMRWGVAGTMVAAKSAKVGEVHWNLSGGYHHASPHSAEGFCIYNDIAITYHNMLIENTINPDDEILIIDVDAHHGNGNAYHFMENRKITIFDMYNNDIYPQPPASKARVDINIPLSSGTNGGAYLDKLEEGLAEIRRDYRLAFVIAGTDVLSDDSIGGLDLTIDECVQRDSMVIKKLLSLNTPIVVLGGGGYSKSSSKAISQSIINLAGFKN